MASIGSIAPLRDCAPLFADMPHLAVLDGGPCAGGRWSYLTADPARVITWDEHSGDGFAELDNVARSGNPPPAWPAPFAGGAIGYLAYDAVFALENLQVTHSNSPPAGYMWASMYDWLVARDEASGQGWIGATGLIGRDPESLVAGARKRLSTTPARLGGVQIGHPTSNLDRAAYRAHAQKVLDYIAAGDCYQVNLARRLSMQCEASGLDVYRQVIARHPAPFGAFISADGVEIVSASPELFLRSDGRKALARPIKGTRSRSTDLADDRRYARELRASAKDRAENLMIVDVMRNDFGRVCSPGTVKVPRLWSVESHPTVWQLVSEVSGDLAAETTSVDLLRACAPSGSVTGAPKLRAIEIIDELEPHRRGAYCGSVFALGFDGSLTANVAIRTLQIAGGQASLHVGAGIVADSDPDLEYDETEHKARGILEALGTQEQ
jgi:para-aminobenzoate synthetase component 1